MTYHAAIDSFSAALLKFTGDEDGRPEHEIEQGGTEYRDSTDRVLMIGLGGQSLGDLQQKRKADRRGQRGQPVQKFFRRLGFLAPKPKDEKSRQQHGDYWSEREGQKIINNA